MAYQYVLQMNEVPDDMVDGEEYKGCQEYTPVRKGDRFLCIKDSDHPSFYSKGKIYVSEQDGCITDNNGEINHAWGPRIDDFFQKIPHPVEKCNCEKCEKVKDKDYFQSIQEEYSKPLLSATEAKIIEECNAIRDLLLSKNKKYGNSAFDSGVFNISPVVAIKARIQDKLNRLKNDNKNEDEDVILDLLGYFILLRIAVKNEQ